VHEATDVLSIYVCLKEEWPVGGEVRLKLKLKLLPRSQLAVPPQAGQPEVLVVLCLNEGLAAINAPKSTVILEVYLPAVRGMVQREGEEAVQPGCPHSGHSQVRTVLTG